MSSNKKIIKPFFEKKGKIVIGIIAVIFFWILYKCGIRITYSPNIAYNWEAISAFATVAGVAIAALIPVTLWYMDKENEIKKQEIGTSNLQLLEELKEFKDEYNDKIEHLCKMIDDEGKFIINDNIRSSNRKRVKSEHDLLKERALAYVKVGMSVNTNRVAKYLNIKEPRASRILDDLYSEGKIRSNRYTRLAIGKKNNKNDEKIWSIKH
ncbi:hypothetical protein QBE53_06040 [Vallitaleaceae bacterium 9-2]